jgi:hypothetical protein
VVLAGQAATAATQPSKQRHFLSLNRGRRQRGIWRQSTGSMPSRYPICFARGAAALGRPSQVGGAATSQSAERAPGAADERVAAHHWPANWRAYCLRRISATSWSFAHASHACHVSLGPIGGMKTTLGPIGGMKTPQANPLLSVVCCIFSPLPAPLVPRAFYFPLVALVSVISKMPAAASNSPATGHRL